MYKHLAVIEAVLSKANQAPGGWLLNHIRAWNNDYGGIMLPDVALKCGQGRPAPPNCIQEDFLSIIHPFDVFWQE